MVACARRRYRWRHRARSLLSEATNNYATATSCTEPADHISSMLLTEIVTKILQHVAEQPRFSSCALVCRSWHTAALAATNSLSVHLLQQAKLASLGSWLQQHGTALKVLRLSSSVNYSMTGTYNVVRLAIQQLHDLKSLSLKSLAVNVDPVIAPSPLGHCLSALTSLELAGVHLQTDDCVKLLTQLTGLRHVRLCSMRESHLYCSSSQSSPVVLSEDRMQCVLESWTQITSLVLDNPGFRDGVLKPLSRLTQLQLLQIMDLHLSTGNFSLPLSLTHLEFKFCDVPDARLFENLLQLQYLDVTYCYLESEADVPGLFAAIQQLKQLKHLSLQRSLRCTTDAEQYTALVSSSQLTYLDLTDCCMPKNAVCRIFATETQHSALHTFQIGQPTPFNQSRWAVSGGAFTRLTCCCPKLAVLHLNNAVHPAIVDEMTVLQQLTTLRELALLGEWVSDTTVVQLANLELPALRDLELASSYDYVGPEGVLCLGDMTQLTRLKICSWQQCHETSVVSNDGNDFCVEFVNRAGLSDLWEQMYNAFKDNVNFAKVLPKLKADCAAAVRRAEVAEQKLEAAERRAEAAEQRAVAAEEMFEAAEQRAEAVERGVDQPEATGRQPAPEVEELQLQLCLKLEDVEL